MSQDKITDIIVIDYNTPEYTQECVESVLMNTDAPYHLHVFDNYFHDYNLSVAWNKLIERAEGDYICLLNSDTEVTEGWLEGLVSRLDADTAVVGPVTNKCGYGMQVRSEASDVENAFEVTHLSGFCLAFRKDVWEEVGGFNEEYELYGEDDEFCRDVHEAGYKLKVAEDVFVYHESGASKEVAEERGKDIEKIRKESANLYRRNE